MHLMKLNLRAFVFGFVLLMQTCNSDCPIAREPGPPPKPPAGGVRLFRADGEHTCQSQSSIGHKCKVSGMNYTECGHAKFDLERTDCCPATSQKGTSIGFTLTKCSTF
jgi:hypothetical protein